MIKVKDIATCYDSLTEFISSKNYYEGMLQTLHEDAAVDEYQAEQPGGAGVMVNHDKNVKKFNSMLEGMDLSHVFGDLYRNGTDEDKAILRIFEQNCEEFHNTFCPELLNPVFEVFDFIKKCENQTLLESQLDYKMINKLLEVGQYIVKNMVYYNLENEEAVIRKFNVSDVLSTCFDIKAHVEAETVQRKDNIMYGIKEETTVKVDWSKYLNDTQGSQEYLNNLIDYFKLPGIKEVSFYNIVLISDFNLLIHNIKSLTKIGAVTVEEDNVKWIPSSQKLEFRMCILE